MVPSGNTHINLVISPTKHESQQSLQPQQSNVLLKTTLNPNPLFPKPPKMVSYSHPNPLLFFFFTFICFTTLAKPDLSSDKAALLTLRSSLRGKTLRWDTNQTSPCEWQGVACLNRRVTSLRLPAGELLGALPIGVLANLTQLRTLSLRLNALSGPLPVDLARCTQLRRLYLQENQFSGELPGFLFGLRNLVRLDLAGNRFSGELSSPGFNSLTRLATLYLQNNQFLGSVPDLNLPKLVQFNVSFNRLNGSIPSKLRAMELSVFEGNSLCGGPMGACPGEKNSTSIDDFKKKKKLSGGAIAGIAIGSVLGFLLLLLIVFILCGKRSSRKTGSVDTTLEKHATEMEKPLGDGNGHDRNLDGGYTGATVPVAKPEASNVVGKKKKKLLFFENATRFFELEDLLRASAEVLGKGTFGTTYKAILNAGTAMAVKRLKDVAMAEEEFRDNIEIVGSMDHKNLVPLRAYYYSSEEKLLVYDYLANGSLSALLHGNRGTGRTPLNWETRSGIALGAACGIEYLHSQGPTVSHGNIKSSNVLLTKDYDGLVCDFGLAQLVAPTSTPNRVAGYRAPEVTDICKVSQKADVYSFGVLLLELLTGKAPTHAVLNEEGVDLPRWVQSVVQEEWTAEVFDLELLRYDNIEDELVQLLQLALDCATQYPDKRPTMTEVVHRIEDICHTRIRLAQDPDVVTLSTPGGVQG